MSPKAIHQESGVAVRDPVSLEGWDQLAGGSSLRTGIAIFGAEPQAKNRQATTGEIAFTKYVLPEVASGATLGAGLGLRSLAQIRSEPINGPFQAFVGRDLGLPAQHLLRFRDIREPDLGVVFW